MSNVTNTILIVEDNDDDVFALQRMLRRLNIANPQQIAAHGQEAVDYLSGTGRFSDRTRFPLPAMMFLDLKMPFLDGFEVLAWIRTQSTLSHIPVIVLTGSNEVKDHARAQALGVRSYLVKPPDPAMLQQLVQSIESDAVSRRDNLEPAR